jgi:hypothetical protein
LIRRLLSLAFVLPGLVLLAGGCAMTFDATTLGVPVTMATAGAPAAEGQRFEVTSRGVYGIWGLVTLRSPSLERALASQLVGGRAVSDVRIRVRSRWSDVLITGLTLGLITPRAVTFEGVVTGGAPAPAAAPAPTAAPAPPPPTP